MLGIILNFNSNKQKLQFIYYEYANQGKIKFQIQLTAFKFIS